VTAERSKRRPGGGNRCLKSLSFLGTPLPTPGPLLVLVSVPFPLPCSSLVTAVTMAPPSLWALSALLPLLSTANGLVFELVRHNLDGIMTSTDLMSSVVSSRA
jgi:hypothetical protein